MKTTYETISSVTPEMVLRRLKVASDRVAAAGMNMVERHLGRIDDGHCPPSDMPPVPVPDLPAHPVSIAAVAHVDQYILDRAKNGVEYPWTDTPLINRGGIKDTATPSQIVSAIRDADAYADAVCEIMRRYRQDTADAITRHTADQVTAVSDLAGLVAGGR